MGAYQLYNSAGQSQGNNDYIGRRGGVRKGDREGINKWEEGLSVERNVILSGITNMKFQPPSFPCMQIHLPKYFVL